MRLKHLMSIIISVIGFSKELVLSEVFEAMTHKKECKFFTHSGGKYLAETGNILMII